MKQLQINVTANAVTLGNLVTQINTGEYKTTLVSFDFSEEWNDKIKKARFGDIEVDIVNDACYFPIILKSGVLPLKVYGYTQTTVNDEPVMTLVYSPTPTAIHVYKGSYDGTRGSNIPAPSGEEEYLTKNILWGGFSDHFNSLSDVSEEAQAAFNAVNVDEMTAREIFTAIENIESLLGGSATLGVSDVQVNGTSVVSSGIASVTVPTDLSDLTDDNTHRTVTDTEKTSWNHIGDWNTTAQGDTVSDVIGNWKEVNSTFSTIALFYMEVITLKEGEYSLTVRNPIDTVIGVYINGQQCYDFSFNENTVTFNNPFEWEDVVEIQYYARVKNIADVIGNWDESLNGRVTSSLSGDNPNKSITYVIGDWNGRSIKDVVGEWTTQNNGTNIAATIGKWFKQNGFNTITDVVNGKYSLPLDGIPENDLSNVVKNKLSKANTSVQPTDLENYYTKASVDSLINALTTLDIQVVQALPIEDISTTTIYLLPKSTIEIGNVYDEYIYVSNLWEKIGSTEIDLSNYYTKTQADGKFVDVSSNQSLTGNKSWNDHGVDTLVVGKGSSSDGGFVIMNKVTSDPSKPVFSTYYKSGKIINGGKELIIPSTANGTLATIADIPTNTSDLTNDSGFLTSHQDISGKQDVLTAGDGIIIQNDTISATIKKYTGTITGDGTTSSFTISHNIGTREVLVNVYDGTTYEDVIVDIERTTDNTLTITFASAPSSSQTYKVVVIG